MSIPQARVRFPKGLHVSGLYLVGQAAGQGHGRVTASASPMATGAQGAVQPKRDHRVFGDPGVTQGLPHRTLNPPDPVGMGAQCALCRKEMHLPA